MEIVKYENAQLILSKCYFADNKMGLVFDETITHDELIDVGKKLKMMEGRIQFFIGDLINANWGSYDHGKYDDLEELGYEKSTLMFYGSVCKSIKSLVRTKDLSFQHHQLVAPLGPHEQEYWLNEAVENSWTVRELRENLKQVKAPELPEGKYGVIYADPPWQYGDKLIKGYGAAEHHYPSMSIQELCELSIKEVTGKNAVLFLWVTSPILEESFEVIKAWGFEYKASFIWDKVSHNYGHYNSVRHEFLLICTKGSCLPESNELVDSVVSIKRTRKHSKKPDEFRQLIEKLYPSLKKIELFARDEVENWDSWGDEIG